MLRVKLVTVREVKKLKPVQRVAVWGGFGNVKVFLSLIRIVRIVMEPVRLLKKNVPIVMELVM